MFVYSTAKGQKTYHTEQCAYAGRIKDEHRGYFQTALEAEAKGYHACIRCSKTGKAFTQQIGKIRHFCRMTGFPCRFRKGKIFVETPVDRWLLFYSEEKKRFITYHQSNTRHSEEGSLKEYHNQKWAFHSVYDTLLSIYDHTNAYLEKKANVPGVVKAKIYYARKPIPSPVSRRKRDKRARKMKEKRKRYEIGRVLDLIDNLGDKQN